MTKTKVCVIGGGPAGMFFCHAMEQQQESVNIDVTVLERAASPGGVWRAAAASDQQQSKNNSTDSTTEMYAGLWTNGPAPSLEFWDYTFQQHFGKAVPVYMPRQLLLEYMLGRVTHKCPDFFDRYFQFHTTVEHVTWEEERQQFRVTSAVQQPETGESRESIEYYDKCVWAAGANGTPIVPRAARKKFLDGNFPGRIRHSSETATFEDDVRDKVVLMIGSGYSSEDLALMAIKLGVKKVCISGRTTSEVIKDDMPWPYDKVQHIPYSTVYKVESNTVHLALCDKMWPGGYRLHEPVQIECSIPDVDTVIFCTGYDRPQTFFDESLRKLGHASDAWYTQTEQNMFALHVPHDDFRIPPHPLDAVLEPPEKVGRCYHYFSNPNFYRNLISIEQPNLMMITEIQWDNPLLGLDIAAWYLASYCLGLVPGIPLVEAPTLALGREECRRQLREEGLRELTNPIIRMDMDEAYWRKVQEYNEDEAWNDPESQLSQCYEKAFEEEFMTYQWKLPARIARESQYSVNFGDFERLSNVSKTLRSFDVATKKDHRWEPAPLSCSRPGRSFRDLSADEAAKIYSVHTGIPCVPLPQLWEDLDTDEYCRAFVKGGDSMASGDSFVEEKKVSF